MNVLVAYATRHGSTAGIARTDCLGTSRAGLAAEAGPVIDVVDLEEYDAFVIGSAPTCSTGSRTDVETGEYLFSVHRVVAEITRASRTSTIGPPAPVSPPWTW